MKVLFLTHYDNMYGANVALYKLLLRLKKDCGIAPLVAIPAEGVFTQRLKEEGIPYYICPMTQWQGVYSSALRFAVKKCIRKRKIKKEVDELVTWLKDKKIEAIHSNSSVIGTGAMLAKRLGCKHIWHIREFSEEHFNMRYFYPKKMVKQYYEEARYLITISDALRENYEMKYPKANIVRVYDGVNQKGYAERKRASDDKIRFCYVGYLFPMKHQLEVVKACKKLMDQGIRNFELYLLGNGKKEYTDLLTDYIEKEKMQDFVKMPGYVSEVSAYLEQMDVGVIASEYEGFGLVTVEYMLHELPVIGYAGGGTEEIIEDGVTGCLYRNEEELLLAMKDMMAHKDKRIGMGLAGMQRAKKYFSEEQNVEKVAELYAKLS